MKKLFIGLILCFLLIFVGCKNTNRTDYNIYAVRSEAHLKKLINTDNEWRYDYAKGGSGNAVEEPGDIPEGEESKKSHSETNVQVEGVDEGDIVKTDGNRIYIASYQTFKVIEVEGDKLELIFEEKIDNDNYYFELYITERYAIVIGSSYSYSTMYWWPSKQSITIDIYDIRTSKIQLEKEIEYSGFYNTSRLIDDRLYVISNYKVDKNKVSRPVFRDDSNETMPNYSEIKYVGGLVNNCYTIFSTIVLEEEIIANHDTFLGFWGGEIYFNKESIYLASPDYYNSKTDITRYSINKQTDHIELEGCIGVSGFLVNQFFMDEYNGYFRVVTTNNDWGTNRIINETNHLYIYEITNESRRGMKLVGSITKGIGKPGETVMSVRFNGDEVSVVTFRQIDPLYIIDLSEPSEPRIVGELEIPGYSSYQHHWDNNTIIGIGFNVENNMSNGIKVSLFDKTDPTDLKEVATLIFQGYAEATYNHKAILIDKAHNIFGFSVNEYELNEYWYYQPVYYLIQVDLTSEEPLKVVAKINAMPEIVDSNNNYYHFEQILRMINIEDYYYAISHSHVRVYTFEEGKIKLVNQLQIQDYKEEANWYYYR
jgi:inhibitor of cysteine peptidase